MSLENTSSASSSKPSPTGDGPKVVFMGTPDFAVPSLTALVESGYKPIAVVTGPDKKRGRGQNLSPTAVKKAALNAGIRHILQPEDVRDPNFAEALAILEPDIIVVVAFRILPVSVFSLSKIGTFNLHGSLLPKYRGAAPINRAIMAGDHETGVTTFLLQEKVDTGNMLINRSMPIGPNETAGEVHDRMMLIGARAVVDTVEMLLKGDFQPEAQDNSSASPAPKIFKQDCEIDWNRPVHEVHNQIRALSPYPGAFTSLGEKNFKIWRSIVLNPEGELGKPGTVIEPGTETELAPRLVVAGRSGSLELLSVQLEGKKAMDAGDFLRGSAVPIGTLLGSM